MLKRYCEICGSKVEDKVPEDETLCLSCLRAVNASSTQVVVTNESKTPAPKESRPPWT